MPTISTAPDRDALARGRRSPKPLAAFATACVLACILVLLTVAGTSARPGDREVADALIWLGVSERTARDRLGAADRRALRRAEAGLGLVPDGHLTAGERAELLSAAEARRAREGYRVVDDAGSGARLGVPLAWMGRPMALPGGTLWRSPDGAIAVRSFSARVPLAAFEERRRRLPGTEITYEAGGADWFVLSGYRDGLAFYMRAAARGSRVRAFQAIYDPALGSRLDRVVVAMSSDFDPFASVAPARPLEPSEPLAALGDARGDARLRTDRAGPLVSLDPVLPLRGPEPRRRAPERFAALERDEPVGPDRGVARRADPEEPAGRRGAGSGGVALDDSPIPPLEGPANDRVGAASTPDATDATDAAIADDATETPVPRRITGLITEEGQSCPTLRGPDGTLYALVGEVPAVAAGTLVRIEAVEVSGERCSAGRQVAVGAFRVLTSR